MQLILSKPQLISLIDVYDNLSTKDLIDFKIEYFKPVSEDAKSTDNYYKITFSNDLTVTALLIFRAGENYQKSKQKL